MSNMQRRKGARWEREVAGMIRDLGIDAHRGLQSAGERVPDVDAPCLWIECKSGVMPNPRAALAQATAAATPGRIPVAVIHDDKVGPMSQRREAFVVLGLADFLELYAQWMRGRCA